MAPTRVHFATQSFNETSQSSVKASHQKSLKITEAFAPQRCTSFILTMIPNWIEPATLSTKLRSTGFQIARYRRLVEGFS
jgi:hypothetical protein